MYSHVTTTGNILGKPSLKDLSTHVAPNVDHKWYGLGVQLFDDKDVKVLTSIELDYRGDVDSCCTKMFERWLEIVPNACWGQLIDGLNAPNVKLHKLANDLLTKLGMSCYNSVCIHFFIYLILQTFGRFSGSWPNFQSFIHDYLNKPYNFMVPVVSIVSKRGLRNEAHPPTSFILAHLLYKVASPPVFFYQNVFGK